MRNGSEVQRELGFDTASSSKAQPPCLLTNTIGFHQLKATYSSFLIMARVKGVARIQRQPVVAQSSAGTWCAACGVLLAFLQRTQLSTDGTYMVRIQLIQR